MKTKNDDNNVELNKPLHPKLPAYKEFCAGACEFELQRIRGLKAQLKKAEKLYIKLQTEIKFSETDESLHAITSQYPMFEELYNKTSNEMYDLDEQAEAQAAIQEKLKNVNEITEVSND